MPSIDMPSMGDLPNVNIDVPLPSIDFALPGSLLALPSIPDINLVDLPDFDFDVSGFDDLTFFSDLDLPNVDLPDVSDLIGGLQFSAPDIKLNLSDVNLPDLLDWPQQWSGFCIGLERCVGFEQLRLLCGGSLSVAVGFLFKLRTVDLDFNQLATFLQQFLTHCQIIAIMRGMSFPIPMFGINALMFDIPTLAFEWPFQMAFASFTAFQPLVCLSSGLHAFHASMLMNWLAPYCFALTGLAVFLACIFFSRKIVPKKFPLPTNSTLGGTEVLKDLDWQLGIGAGGAPVQGAAAAGSPGSDVGEKYSSTKVESADERNVAPPKLAKDDRARMHKLRNYLYMHWRLPPTTATGASSGDETSGTSTQEGRPFLTPTEREKLATLLAQRRLDDVGEMKRDFEVNMGRDKVALPEQFITTSHIHRTPTTQLYICRTGLVHLMGMTVFHTWWIIVPVGPFCPSPGEYLFRSVHRDQDCGVGAADARQLCV